MSSDLSELAAYEVLMTAYRKLYALTVDLFEEVQEARNVLVENPVNEELVKRIDALVDRHSEQKEVDQKCARCSFIGPASTSNPGWNQCGGCGRLQCRSGIQREGEVAWYAATDEFEEWFETQFPHKMFADCQGIGRACYEQGQATPRQLDEAQLEEVLDAARPVFLALESGATSIEAMRTSIVRQGVRDLSFLPDWFTKGSGHLTKQGRAALVYYIFEHAKKKLEIT